MFIMNIMKRLLLLIVMFLFTSAVSSFAEDFTITSLSTKTMNSEAWQDAILDAKEETAQLLRENDRLNAEYDVLKQQLVEIQTSVLTLKEDLAEQEVKNKNLQRFRQDQLETVGRVKREIDKVKNAIADLENEKLLSTKKLEEEQKQTKIWAVRLSEREVKKRELALELKLQEISLQELEQGKDQEIEDMKRELRALEQKEQGIDRAINEAKKKSRHLPQQIDKIVIENKELELKIAQLEQEKQTRERANQDFSEQNTQLADARKHVPKDLLKEKGALEKDISSLEKELDAIKVSVQDSISVIQKKRQLMNDIMRMDQENQSLRTEISNLMDDIEASSGDTQP